MLPVPVPTRMITTPILSGATRPQCATPSLHTPHPLHLQGETPEIARLSPRACPPLARAIHQTMPRGLNQPPSPSLCDATSPRSQPPPACRKIRVRIQIARTIFTSSCQRGLKMLDRVRLTDLSYISGGPAAPNSFLIVKSGLRCFMCTLHCRPAPPTASAPPSSARTACGLSQHSGPRG